MHSSLVVSQLAEYIFSQYLEDSVDTSCSERQEVLSLHNFGTFFSNFLCLVCCYAIFFCLCLFVYMLFVIRIASSIGEVFGESTADHLLLFVCALIPKAMASLLTSTILELSKSDNVRDTYDCNV